MTPLEIKKKRVIDFFQGGKTFAFKVIYLKVASKFLENSAFLFVYRS